MDRPRIALVTFLWPLRDAPYAGKPIYETALRLREYAEIEVFCPSPRYPEVSWLRPATYVYHRPDPEHAPPGLHTHYLEYLTLPLAGRLVNGLSVEAVLAPALRDFRPDLILCYWLYPTGWAAVNVGKRMGVPVIVGSRGSDLHRIPGRWTRSMTASTLRRASAVVTVTEDLRRLAAALGAEPSRTHSIPNGCDAQLYRPQDRQASRSALNLPAEGELLVQVGHLIAAKGVFDLLAAFGRIAASRPNLRLALVGEGPAQRELRQRAAQAGLAARLLLPGARPAAEIPLWLNAADLCCLASHGEGCPNVVVEALACGRPVAGCDVGGIPELVNADCGVLAPPSDPPALAEAIARALDTNWQPDLIAARFARSWETVARETFEVCGTVLRSAGGV